MDRQIENKSKPKAWIWLLAVTAFTGVSASILINSGGKTVRLRRDHVQLAEVKQAPFEEYIALTGTVEPYQTVMVVALEEGIVTAVSAEDGDSLRKGAPILRLENQDLEMEYINRQTALLDQLNNLRNSQVNLDQTNYTYQQDLIDLKLELDQARMRFEAETKLMSDSLLAVQDYERSRMAFEALRSRYQLLQTTNHQNTRFRKNQAEQLNFSSSLIRQSLERLKSSLEKLGISAPASGLLTGFDVQLGQHIRKGDKVAEIDLLQGYLLNTLVDEIYISRVSKGLKGKLKLDDQEYTLEVIKVYPQVTNGQFRVDLRFEEMPEAALKYGQSLPLRLSLGEPTNALLLKRGGFYQKTGGAWVYVVDGDKAIKRSTNFGRQNPDFYEILSGLKSGEQVIVSGYAIFGEADEIILE